MARTIRFSPAIQMFLGKRRAVAAVTENRLSCRDDRVTGFWPVSP
jgi:hypothetical protein